MIARQPLEKKEFRKGPFFSPCSGPEHKPMKYKYSRLGLILFITYSVKQRNYPI